MLSALLLLASFQLDSDATARMTQDGRAHLETLKASSNSTCFLDAVARLTSGCGKRMDEDTRSRLAVTVRVGRGGDLIKP